MFANAAQTVPASTSVTNVDIDTTANTINDTKKVASAAFVKGAYNAIQGEIRNISADIDVTSNGNTITAANSVAENLGALDTKIGALVSQLPGSKLTQNGTVSENLQSLNNAIITLTGDASDAYVTKVSATASPVPDKQLRYVDGTDGTKVGVNFGILDNQVYTNTTAISTLNDAVTESGSVLYMIDNNAVSAKYSNSTSGLQNTTIQGAIDEVEGRVDTLEAGVNQSGSVLNSIRENAANATYDNDNTDLTAETINTAIDEVANKQIPMVTDWTNQTVEQVKIGELVTFVAP